MRSSSGLSRQNERWSLQGKVRQFYQKSSTVTRGSPGSVCRQLWSCPRAISPGKRNARGNHGVHGTISL